MSKLIARRLREHEESLRLHPDPHVRARAGEIKQLRLLLEKQAGLQADVKNRSSFKERVKTTSQCLALVKLAWELLQDITKRDGD